MYIYIYFTVEFLSLSLNHRFKNPTNVSLHNNASDEIKLQEKQKRETGLARGGRNNGESINLPRTTNRPLHLWLIHSNQATRISEEHFRHTSDLEKKKELNENRVKTAITSNMNILLRLIKIIKKSMTKDYKIERFSGRQISSKKRGQLKQLCNL